MFKLDPGTQTSWDVSLKTTQDFWVVLLNASPGYLLTASLCLLLTLFFVKKARRSGRFLPSHCQSAFFFQRDMQADQVKGSAAFVRARFCVRVRAFRSSGWVLGKLLIFSLWSVLSHTFTHNTLSNIYLTPLIQYSLRFSFTTTRQVCEWLVSS